MELTPILFFAAIVVSTCALTLAVYEHFHEPKIVFTQSRFCASPEFRPMVGGGFGGRSVEP